ERQASSPGGFRAPGVLAGPLPSARRPRRGASERQASSPRRFRAPGVLAAALPSARRPRQAASERQASEERPGFAGALPSVGGFGGPFRGPPSKQARARPRASGTDRHW